MTEHFHLWALLVAQGNIYPIPAYTKAKELLAEYNKERTREEEQAKLESVVAGAIAAGGESSTSGDAAKLVAAATQDSK